MFYGGEEALQLRAKGPYHAIKEPHQNLLQGYPCFFSRYVQFYQGLNLLQEDVVFLQEDAVFLQEGVDFLQESTNFLHEGRTFYRKLCVLQETSCRSFGRPEFILKRDFATMDWLGCMQASVGILARCCHHAPPPVSTCGQVPAQTKKIDEISRESHFQRLTNDGISYHMHQELRDCDREARTAIVQHAPKEKGLLRDPSRGSCNSSTCSSGYHSQHRHFK